MLGISSASLPIVQGPNVSPTSELKSILIFGLTDHFSRQYAARPEVETQVSIDDMKRFRTVLFWMHLTAGVARRGRRPHHVRHRRRPHLREANARVGRPPVLVGAVLGRAPRICRQRRCWRRCVEAQPGAAPTGLTLRADPRRRRRSRSRATRRSSSTHTPAPSSATPPQGLRAFFRTMTDWHRYLALEGASRPPAGDHRRRESRLPLHRAQRDVPLVPERLDVAPGARTSCGSAAACPARRATSTGTTSSASGPRCRSRSSSPAPCRSRIRGRAISSIAWSAKHRRRRRRRSARAAARAPASPARRRSDRAAT